MFSTQADITWTGAVSSEWNNRTNWNPKTVPQAGDTVIIKSGGVVVASESDQFSVLKWAGGWIGGTLNVAGDARVEIDTAGVACYGTVNNAGTIRLSGGGNFQFTSKQPRVNNLPGGTWLVENDHALLPVNAQEPLFINAGTFRKTGGTEQMDLVVPFRNSGKFLVESGAVVLKGDFENQPGAKLTGEFVGGAGKLWGTLADTINWSSGVLYFDLVTTPAAAIHLYSDAAKYIAGELNNGGTITWKGRGNLYLYATRPRLNNLAEGSILVENDCEILPWQAESPLIVNAGTFRKTGDVGYTTLRVPFENSGRFVVEKGALFLNTELVNLPGATFTTELYGSGGTVRGALANTLTWTGGSLTFDATNTATGVLNLRGDQEKYLAGTLHNAGTIHWSDLGKLYLWEKQPRLNNLAEGTILVENDCEILPWQAESPLIVNAGTFRKTGDVGYTTLRVPFENSGRFVVEKGALFLNTELVNLPGATFTTELYGSGGTVRGALANTLTWTGGSLTFDATNTATGVLNLRGDQEKYLAGTLHNAGTIHWSDLGKLYLWEKQPRLNNLAEGSILVENDCEILPWQAESPLIVNAGTFRKTGDVGYTTLSVPLENMGQFVVEKGELYLQTTLVNHPGAVLAGAIAGGSGTLRGILADTLDWASGALFFDTTNTPTALLNISGEGDKHLLGDVYNWGTVRWRGRGNLYLATFRNLASGVFVAENSSQLNYWGGATAPKFFNDGVFAKTTDGGITSINVPFDNRNTLDVERGTLSINSTYTQAGGRLQVRIDDEVTYGAIGFAGVAPLTGLFGVTLRPGFLPVAGTTFPLVTYPSKTGTFTGMELPTSLVWQTNYEAKKFTLKVTGFAPDGLDHAIGPSGDWKAGSTADPVNTAIGNFTHSETDLSVGSRGPTLTLGRFYNSRSSFLRSLGRGWTHTYDVSLSSAANGVALQWSDGRVDHYAETGGDAYNPVEPGIYDTLRHETDATWTLVRKDLATYRFDPQGRLLSVADRNGNALICAYDAQGRLATVSDPADRRLTFSYCGEAMTGVTDPVGRTVSFGYVFGRLDTVTDVLGKVVKYTYDANSYLESVTDQRGVMTVFNVYDAQGRVIAQRDGRNNSTGFAYDTPSAGGTTLTNALGHLTIHSHTNYLLTRIVFPDTSTIEYTYDVQQNRTSIKDRNGNKVRFEYDQRGNVTRTLAPDGGITTVVYGDSRFPHLPTRKTDAANGITQWQYDANGNTVLERHAAGTALQCDKTWGYNTWGQPLVFTNELGYATTYHYATNADLEGLLVSVEDTEGNRTWYDYDALWRRTKVIDARSSGPADSTYATIFSYDASDRLISVAGPITSRSYAYDPIGNRTFERDGNGNERTYEYDENSNLRVVREPLGRVSEYRYDALNRKVATIDPNGHETACEYDPMGNLVRITRTMYGDGADLVSTNGYDPHGNVLVTVDPSGRKVIYTYDTMHRMTAQRDGLDHVWHWDYDKLGRRLRALDATGLATQSAYDALGRLQSLMTFDDLGQPQVTRYDYDLAGNLTKITDPAGRKTEKAYDKLGRLISEKDGLGGEWRYAYDPADNQVSVSDANGNRTEMAYDTENRLAEIRYPDSTQVTFTYDGNGNRLTMTDAIGTTTYDYDALDRLTASTDAYWQKVGYAYDLAGNRTSLSYPDGLIATNTFDTASRLRSVTDWRGRTTSYQYDTAGRLVGMTYPNGVTHTRAYDPAGRLSAMDYRAHGTNLISYSWTRDEEGNPLTQTEDGPLAPVLNLPARVTYAYDTDNRLTNRTEGGCLYDRNGNLTNRTVNAATTTFAYDCEDRLVRQAAGNSSVQHFYDGTGYRVARTENGLPTRYVLDRGRSMSHVLCETDRTGKTTAWYLHGPQIIARLGADGSQRYYLTDAIGSVVALVDETGRVTDRYAYTPFGVPAGQEGKSPNPFRYIGGLGVMAEKDGLYYMRARFYEPDLGVFLHKDPLGNHRGGMAGSHAYLYAQGNPVTYVDPEGLYLTSGWDYLHAFFDIGSGVLGLTGAMAAEVPFGIAGALGIIKGGLTGERDVQERGVAGVLFGLDMMAKSAEQGGQGVANLIDPTKASSYRTAQREVFPRPSRDILMRQGYGEEYGRLETIWAIAGLWNSLEKAGPAWAEARAARADATLLKETLRNARQPVPAGFGFAALEEMRAQGVMQVETAKALAKLLRLCGNAFVWPRDTSPFLPETDTQGISRALKH